MANVTFLCSQVPYSLCSVHGFHDPSQPLARSDLPLHGSVFFTQVMVTAAPGIQDEAC